MKKKKKGNIKVIDVIFVDFIMSKKEGYVNVVFPKRKKIV